MAFENIRKLRILSGMTQWELGEALGISASAVGMYEQGRREPDSKTLIKMSKIFGVSVDEILNGEKNNDINLFCEDFLKTLSKREFTLENEKLSKDEIALIENAVRVGVEVSTLKILKERESGR